MPRIYVQPCRNSIAALIWLLACPLAGAAQAPAGPPGDAFPADIPQPVSGLPRPIAAALAASGIAPSNLSIHIGAADGSTRLDWLGAVPRQPGSLIKLLTTVAALDRLGPAFRFRTDLTATPLPGQPRRWQLALRGGGDPGLRFEDLEHLLRAARAAGATHLAPQVQIDSRRFGADPGATTGIRQDADRVGSTPPYPLLVEQAAVQVSLPPGRQGSPLADPPYPLEVAPDAHVPGETACPADWPDGLHLQLQAGAAQPDAQPALRLTGPWPSACQDAVLLRAPLGPDAYLELALATAAHRAGFTERLHVTPGSLPDSAPIQLHQDSRPLADLVRDINKFSNNVMARTLFLDLAAEAGDLPATPQAAARVLAGWLRRAGLDFPELLLENGAGLSHREQLSASHLDDLLRYALTSSYRAEFMSSLPIPGADGTLRKKFRSLVHSERLRLKSGSLDGVHGLAGYVLAPDGRSGTVVCVINDPHTEAAAALEQAVLAWALGDESATGTPP